MKVNLSERGSDTIKEDKIQRKTKFAIKKTNKGQDNILMSL